MLILSKYEIHEDPMKKVLFFALVLTLFVGCKNDEYQKIEKELLTERTKQQEKHEYGQHQKNRREHK